MSFKLLHVSGFKHGEKLTWNRNCRINISSMIVRKFQEPLNPFNINLLKMSCTPLFTDVPTPKRYIKLENWINSLSEDISAAHIYSARCTDQYQKFFGEPTVDVLEKRQKFILAENCIIFWTRIWSWMSFHMIKVRNFIFQLIAFLKQYCIHQLVRTKSRERAHTILRQ